MSGINFNYNNRKKKKKNFIIYTVISLITVITIFFFLNILLSVGKVSPGVMIKDIPIGGIDKEKAKKIITRYTNDLLENQIFIHIGDRIESITPKELKITFLNDKILKDALKFKKSLNPIIYIKQSLISEYSVPLKINYNRKLLEDYYVSLKEKYEIPPVNAVLEDNKRIIRGKKGIKFKTNVDQFITDILNTVINNEKKKDIFIKLDYIDPEITFNDILKKLNLSTLISMYKTSIKEKEKGSRFNVLLSAKKIDGIIIHKGEEFSYNEIVGPAEKNDGFQEGLVIVGGKFVMGYGGGVCQTSSTLYNAVLLAGLKILERHNHSIYSDTTNYVPLGRDAAVYYGYKDLRFKNTLPYPIVIGAHESGDYLVIEIWGREKPKEKIEIITKGKEVITYKTIKKEDPNLKKGESIVEVEGINGYRIKTYLIINKDGVIKEKFLSNDYYRPIDRIVKVGKWEKIQ